VEYIIYLLFFLLGITFTKAFGFVMNVGYSVRMLKVSEITILHMLISIAEDVAFAREIKYYSAERAGLDQDSIDRIKLIDDQTMNNWKELVVKKLIQCYPHTYKSYLEYSDWSGAIQYLERVSKEK